MTTIAYSGGQISFNNLLNTFFSLIGDLKVPLEEVAQRTAKKNQIRGGFSKRIMMEYILIPPISPYALDSFLGANNIFSGIKIIENQTYYKFITHKAIRDHLPRLTLSFHELFTIKDPLIPIAKVFIAAEEEFFRAIRLKLIEETKEVLYSKTSEELQEELGDVYGILLAIGEMNFNL